MVSVQSYAYFFTSATHLFHINRAFVKRLSINNVKDFSNTGKRIIACISNFA